MTTRRIVSLVPSLTHMVAELGLKDELVGCTTFCIAPPDLARRCTLVGGTKDPEIDTIAGLRPTHILVNEEENKPEHIEACRRLASTFVTFPKAPDEVPALLRGAGEWLGVEAAAEGFARDVEAALARLDEVLVERRRLGAWRPRSYLYFIWREPYMVVAQDTYISAMLARLGLVNVAPATPRYPTLSVAEAKALAPELLLLSSEPFPFRQRNAAQLREEWGAECPEILKIDGQLLSWYGTMLLPALRELTAWIEGEAAEVVKPL